MFFLQFSFISFSQEGSKQLIESLDGSGEVDTVAIVLFNGRNADSTIFTYDAQPDARLYFKVNEGDEVYMGMNVKFNETGNAFDFRVRGPVVGDPLSSTGMEPIVLGPLNARRTGLNMTNGGEGFIGNVTQAINGAMEVTGAGGYDGLNIPITGEGVYYIEFEGISGRDRAWVSYFDLSIKDEDGDPVSGRLFSYHWSLYNNIRGAGGFDVTDLDFYSYHDKDSVIVQIQMEDIEPGGFQLALTDHGIANGGNLLEDRKSRPYEDVSKDSILGEFPIFFAKPDTICFPIAKAEPGLIVGETVCGEVNCLQISTTKDGNIEMFLDLDGPDGVFTANTADTMIIAVRLDSGAHCIEFDTAMLDIFSSPVTIAIKYSIGQMHFPAGDFEENLLGFNGQVIDLAFSGGTPLEFFHDDSSLPLSVENTMPNGMGGCETDCHIWGSGSGASSSSYGNNRWVNTWWDGYRIRETIVVDFENCAVYDCTDSIDNDGDGLADCDDPDCFTGITSSLSSTCTRIELDVTDPEWEYLWYFNDVVIGGATDSFYEDMAGLADGTYKVQITHPSGCTATFSEVIDCIPGSSCFDGETLALDATCEIISVVSPQPDWTFTWYHDGAEIVGATDSFYQPIGGLDSGLYEVDILDADDCMETLSETLDCCRPTTVSISGN